MFASRSLAGTMGHTSGSLRFQLPLPTKLARGKNRALCGTGTLYPEDESKGLYRRSWITGIMAVFMSANDSSIRVMTGTLSLLISSSSGSGVTNTLPIESCASSNAPTPGVAGKGQLSRPPQRRNRLV